MVKDEDLVKFWQTATSVDDVMKSTGMKKQAISSRIGKLRKLGVPLKKFKRENGTKNIDKLKALAESLSGVPVPV